MIKRLLIPGYLFFFLCACLCAVTPAKAQDTTKAAAQPERKVEAEKATVVSTITPVAAKPANHFHKNPQTGQAVPGKAAPENNDSVNIKTQIDPNQLTTKSLYAQYQYLLSKTYHYQQPLVVAFWKNASDSINHVRVQMKEMQAKMHTKDHSVDSLKADMTAKEQELSGKSDSISLLGIDMTKGSYNMIMLSLIAGLTAALVIVILTTAKHKHEAKHRTELYEEIEEDYRNFKIKANEKEKKLARELQTERNKLDELLGRG